MASLRPWLRWLSWVVPPPQQNESLPECCTDLFFEWNTAMHVQDNEQARYHSK
ncbi:hypothetical protein [Mycolicibacterium vulneris]|uniref:hypothetical protein n=1 Tax=Mycolicibacterium vulneris TaxID=547163 RepID=UPI0013FDC6EC|nr:hypothetical protein [Mycolicibacterium vulneris]